MTYAIVLGSDAFIGTTGVLTVEDQGKQKEFFRVRDVDRARSTGSYIVIDCDIKDPQGNREIKLFKNRPVASGEEINVEFTPQCTRVTREDGTTVVLIEEIRADDTALPVAGPVREALKSVDAVLRITGDFQAGPHRVIATTEETRIGGITLGGNLSIGTGGIRLTPMGFSM